MDQATIRDKSRMFKERICKGCVGKKCKIWICFNRNTILIDFGELIPTLTSAFSFKLKIIFFFCLCGSGGV